MAFAALAGTIAKADDGILLLQNGQMAVIDLAGAGQIPVVLAEGGMRPADCPDGAFWVDEIGIGAVLTECAGGAQYQVEGAIALGYWKLKPWPRPHDDDDAGPRVR